MLKRVHIEHFRSLGRIEVPLAPLTVLIGENDTGKSTFVRAMSVLGQIAQWTHDDLPRLKDGVKPEVTAWDDAGQVFSRVMTHVDPKSRISTGLYALPSAGPDLVSGGYDDSTGAPPAFNLIQEVPALFDYLLRKDRARFTEAEAVLKKLIKGLEGLNVLTPTSGSRSLELQVDGGLRLPVASVSAGVRLLIFFVALSFHPNSPSLVLIEEPENGIHPQRIKEVVQILREITSGTHGLPPRQVIITTHSPYLLDCVDPAADQVLVFRRENDGTRTATPIDADRLKGFLHEFQLGEVWFNQGELGLIGRPK